MTRGILFEGQNVDGDEKQRRRQEVMMSERAIEFLQEWISEKVHVRCMPARLEKEAEMLAKECAAEAADAGVPLEDIEEEVGDLEELIATKLEDAAQAEGDVQGRERNGIRHLRSI